MSQPTTYVRAFNFTNQQSVTPSDPIRADKLDLELNLVKTSLDETQANLALIQRDDGAVRNATIGYDQLKAELNGFGFNPPTPWLTATNYIARDTVFAGTGFYQCLVSHISGVFATDLAAGKWLLVADFTSATTAAAASAAAALVSQNAAAASATAANTSAATATTAAADTDADRIETSADRVQTGLDRAATTADVVSTHADVVLTHADVALTHADAVATAADRVQTGLDRIAAAASAATAQTFAFAVSYIAQVLTSAQKLIARTNIEAGHVNDARPSLIVNGSMQDSAENGTALGTTSGYFAAEMFALLYVASTAAMSVQLISTRTLSGNDRAIELKTTTAKASLAATDFVTLTTIIEGSRPEWKAAAFGTAGAKPFVHRFETTRPAGAYHKHVQNSAGTRHCSIPYTISAGEANSQVVKTVTIPADTSGTWLFGDGDKGLIIDDVLAAGSTLTGGSANTWGGTAFLAATTQFNILSSTSNVARLADVGLKNDPDATAVYGLFRVGERDAKFNSERHYKNIIGFWLSGAANSGSSAVFSSFFGVPMAKVPTMSAITTASTVNVTTVANSATSASQLSLLVTPTATGAIRASCDLTVNARL